MLRLDADAPKPPTYPFSFNSFKEHEDKTNRGASLPAFPEQPCLQNFRRDFRRTRSVQPAFQRTVRFGEAVFRSGPSNPQEENDGTMTFSYLAP